ncbi:MAG: hypothetical protein KatS3mg104_2726 [Phycisphaerae bacterium]|nr:MAG: hypothetical protein KatS3mg104_2726 [Phycisphaerae bacterium]
MLNSPSTGRLTGWRSIIRLIVCTGGRIGYDRRFWEVTPFHSPEGPAIRLTLTDLDGTEQYPGTVHVEVTYTLTILGTWRITYSATTDQITPINLTQHAYFNLKDGGRSPITDHLLQMPCTHYTPTDASLIPTGEICPVAGSAHDFTQPKPLGRDFNRLESDPVGYDCNYVIPGPSGTLRWAASVTEPVSGRSMQVYTTQPGVQLYTGNFLGRFFIGNRRICLSTARRILLGNPALSRCFTPS